MMVYPEGVFYTQVHAEDVKELVEEHCQRRILERLLYKEPETEAAVKDFRDTFFKHQVRIAYNCGIIDPDIDEYIARDLVTGAMF